MSNSTNPPKRTTRAGKKNQDEPSSVSSSEVTNGLNRVSLAEKDVAPMEIDEPPTPNDPARAAAPGAIPVAAPAAAPAPVPSASQSATPARSPVIPAHGGAAGMPSGRGSIPPAHGAGLGAPKLSQTEELLSVQRQHNSQARLAAAAGKKKDDILEQQLAGRLNVQAQQTIDKVTSRLKKAAIEEAAIAKVILDRLKKEQFDIICAYPIKGKTLCSNLGDVGRAGPFCFCKTHAGKMSANASVRREFLRRMEHHFDKIKRALPPGLESATIENNLETLIDEAINSGEFSN